MKCDFFLGAVSVGQHGDIDPRKPFGGRALTGSEAHLFNLATGLADLGHDCTVYCPTKEPFENQRFHILPIDQYAPRGDSDLYLTVSEPDLLRHILPSSNGLRIVLHQLGDFYQAQSGFDEHVDAYAFVSHAQMKHVLDGDTWKIPPAKCFWLPNSINPEFFSDHPIIRDPHSAAWISSADRGLHRLLELWPHVRKRVPDAKLRIYYRFAPWYEHVKDLAGPFGDRGRYIANALSILGTKGEHGIYLMDAVPNRELAKQLCATGVVPYTFDPIAYTETFSIAMMDACAAGCVPITSDLDALGDIYKNVAHIISGRPQAHRDEWLEAIIKAMTDETWASLIRKRAHAFSTNFHRQRVAEIWEEFLEANKDNRGKPLDKSMLPETMADYPPARSIPPSHNEREWEGLDAHTDASGFATTLPRPTNPIFIQSRGPTGPGPSIRPTSAPLVSVLVMLSRPGGIDITFAGLRDQTFKDFETILVDNRYEKRHHALMQAAAEYGLKNVIHTPEHRRNSKWIVACAAFNTAIMLARGKYVIILHDYAYVPPGWIESHLQQLEGHPKRLVVANHVNVDLPALTHPLPEFDATDRPCLDYDEAFEKQHELYVFKDGRFDPSWPQTIGPKQWQPGYANLWKEGHKPDKTWITLTNDSIDREFLWDVGGIDERFDLGRGPFDINLGIRLAEAGGDVVWVDEPRISVFNPRFVMRTLPYGDPNDRIDGRWSKADAYVYQTNVEKDHPVHRHRANNPYPMRDLAAQLEIWRKPDVRCIPREISDINYYGRQIKPDSGPDIINYSLKHPPIEISEWAPTKAPAISRKLPIASILVPAYRPGGIDITFAALRDQGYKDFEVIVVDRRYEKRHQQVMTLAGKYGLNVVHTPEHRRNGHWITAATAYNTAAALAKGYGIIFLHEWWWVPPNWLETHLDLLEKDPLAISLTGYTTREPPELKTRAPFSFETGRELIWDDARSNTKVTTIDDVLAGNILDEIYAFAAGPFDPSMISDLKTIKDVPYRPNDMWQQDCRPQMFKQGTMPNHTWSIMCNDGMRRSLFLSLGGHDELFDKTKGLFDVEFSRRAEKVGAKFLWSPDVTCVSIRPQKIARTMPVGGMNERIHNRWSNTDGETYYKRQNQSPRTKARNPIRIEDITTRISHWRDPHASCIPLDVPDAVYWGRDPLWPEDLPDSWFSDLPASDS